MGSTKSWSIIISVFVFVFSLLIEPAFSAEEMENNDSMVSANALTSGQDMLGTISRSSDVDFFKLYAPQAGRITFKLASVPDGLNLGMYVYDQQGNYWFYVDSKAEGGQELASFYVDEAGDYALQIYRSGGISFSTVQYRLQPLFSPLSEIDPFEPNNSIYEASLVLSGEINQSSFYRDGDEDYYKIEVDGPGQIVFELTSVPETLDLGMEFWGSYENHLGWQDYNRIGIGEYSRLDVGQAGSYYVRIYRSGGTPYSDAPYSFRATFTPQSAIDFYEPNNDLISAAEVSPGAEVWARVQYPGDQDYYRVLVAEPGFLTITLTDVPSEIGMFLDFWDPKENYLGSADSWGEGVGERWSAYVSESGYYYINAYAGGGYSDTPYRLLVNFTPLTEIDPNEPNDTLEQATELTTGVFLSGKIQSSGDYDWYKVYVDQLNLTVEITDVPREIGIGFHLYDAAGSYMGGSDIQWEGGSEVATFEVSGLGDYYIQTFASDPWGGASSNSYKIRAYGGIYQNLSTFTVKPAAATTYIAFGAVNGMGLRLVPEGKDASGKLVLVEPSWTVEAGTGDGTIDSTGWFTPTRPGTAKVRATVDTISAAADVTIVQVTDGGGEPNDIFTKAFRIGPTGTFSDGKIFPEGDVDIYRIDLPQAGQLVVEAQGGDDLDLNLEIYSASLGWMTGSNRIGNGGKERLSVNTAGPACYFVRVTGAGSSFSPNPYILTSTFTPVPDSNEPNNQWSRAKILEPNSPTEGFVFPEGDKDCYRIALSSSGRLSVSLTDISAPLDGLIYLYDGNFNQIGSADGLREGGSENLAMNLDAGTYYILVQESGDNNYSLTPYHLSAGFLPLSNLDIYEINDSIEEARLLASGETKTDSLIYQPGDVDYFWLPVNGTGSMVISVTNVASDLDIKMELYDRAGNLKASRDTGFSGESETLQLSSVLSTDYYIKIFDFNNRYSDQPYTLTATYPSAADVTPPAIPLGLLATPGDGLVFISWLPNKEFDLAGYEVFRSSAAGGDYVQIASTLGNSHIDLDATNGNTFFYRIKAYDRSGNRSQASAEVSAAPMSGLALELIEKEANNDLFSANPVISGSEMEGAIANWNDSDFYKISVPGRGQIIFELVSVAYEVNLGLQVFDSQQNYWFAADSKAEGGKEKAVLNISQAGTYWVHVYPSGGSPAFSEYAMKTLFVPQIEIDPYEANDRIVDSYQVLSGQLITDARLYRDGDEDYYRVEIDGPGQIVFEITSVPETLDLVMDFWGPDESYLGSENYHGAGIGEYRRFDVDQPGPYYMRIYRTGSVFSDEPYSFRITFTPQSAIDSYEPNHDMISAIEVTEGVEIASRIQGPWDTDYFKVLVAGPGYLTVTLIDVPPELGMGLQLWGPSESHLGSADSWGEGVGERWSAYVSESGYYYINAYAGGGYSDTPYRLLVNFTPLTEIDPNEPNDTLEQATELAAGIFMSGKIQSNGDYDWYKIYVNYPNLTVEIGDVPLDLGVWFSLYDAAGNSLGGTDSQWEGGSEVATYDISGAGYCYIQVYSSSPWWGVSSNNPYKIRAYFGTYQDLSALTVKPSAATTYIASGAGQGLGLRFAADGKDVSGNLVPVNPDWTVEAGTGDGTIDNAGYFTPTLAGTARINATVGSLSAEVVVTIVEVSDGGEPNDDFSQAATIGPLGTFSDGKIYPGYDVDIYRVDLTEPGQLVVEAQGGEDLDLNLELYNSSANWVTGVNWIGGGGKERLSVNCPAPDYFFVRVTGTNGSFSPNAYTLTSIFTPAADGFEANNYFSEAKPIELNSPVGAFIFPEGDQDFYELTLPSPGRLTISLTEVSAPLNGIIYLYDSNWNQIGWVDDFNEGGNEVLQINLGPGTYYVHVFDDNNNNYSLAPYHLSADFLPLAEEDPYEINDEMSGATPLPIHVMLTESTIYYPGDVDYYLLQMAEAGPAEIRLDNVPENLDLRIELYSDTGAFLAARDANYSGEGETLRINLTQGSYYVRIFDINNQFSDETYSIMAPDVIPPSLSLAPVLTPTRFSEQTLTGSVEAGATVEVSTGSSASDGPAVVTGTTWSYTVTGLMEGANDITVTATDAADNSSHVNTSITRDTVPPALALDSVSRLINSGTLTVTGTAEPGAVVQVATDTSASDGPATRNGNAWSYTITGLVEGPNGITVTATDAADNSSTVASSVILDTTPPTGSVTINGGAPNTNTTSVTLNLSATDTNGVAQMLLWNNNDYHAETMATSTVWSLLPGDGTKTVYVKFRDAAENWSQAFSDTIVLDTTPPAAPTLNTVISPTMTTPQAISGTKEANSSIWLGGTEIVALDAATTWSHSLELTEGTNSISLTSKDAVGNQSSAVAGSIVFDITPPAAPTLNAVTSPTRTTPQSISGTKEANSSIWLNGTQIVEISAQTTWSYSLALTEGTSNFSLTARDAAGNESGAVSGSIVFDIGPPATLTLSAVTTPTRTTPQVISGTKEAESSVWLNGAQIVPIDAQTTWSYALALMEGSNNISLTAKDAAGNESIAVTGSIVLDTTPPMISINPVVTPTNVDYQAVTGTVEAGATVTVVTDTPASDGSAIVTGTTWSYEITGLAEGSNLITITATDAAGNASTATSNITLDRAPPVAMISGAPQGESCATSVTLKVEGTGVISYRHKLDNQPYGAETDVTIPISLSNLTIGSHTIQVIGKNQAGNWQSEESSTIATWIVSVARRGDIDGSGQVDLNDAILLLKVFTDHDEDIAVNSCGDVNGNGTLDQMDLIYILQKLVFVRD